MLLSKFRHRLAVEINDLNPLLQPRGLPSREIQVHLYCIAALLRRILDRLTQFEHHKIRVRERGITANRSHFKEIGLKSLVSIMLHYVDMYPIVRGDFMTDHVKYIRLLSPEDQNNKNLKMREFVLADLLGVAKQIAEDDKMIMDALLMHTKGELNKVIRSCSDENPILEIETRDSLEDCFELLRKTSTGNLPDGNITAFRELFQGSKIVGMQSFEIEYEDLFNNFLTEWRFCPFFHLLEPYSEKHHPLEFQSKTVILTEGGSEPFIIRTIDLLTVLNAIRL